MEGLASLRAKLALKASPSKDWNWNKAGSGGPAGVLGSAVAEPHPAVALPEAVVLGAVPLEGI